MNWKNALWIGIAALIAVVALFEISFDFQFSSPGEVRQLDAKQEERYETCFAQRDKEIHDVAFATIDNPDVQKLYISNNRDLAVAECRAQFPKHWTVVDAPLRFKLIDLRFRF
jgi:hypothetical protein